MRRSTRPRIVRASYKAGLAHGGWLGGVLNCVRDLWADTVRGPRRVRADFETLAERDLCSHSRTLVIRRVPRGILRCTACQIAFAPVRDGLAAATDRHDDAYFLANKDFTDPNGRPNCFEYVLPRQLFFWALGFPQYRPTNRRALDVGCGQGIMVRWLEFLGFEGHGVEISSWAVEYARRELGLQRVYQGTVQQQGFPEAHFSLVTLVHVLEHLDDPVPVLREIFRVLEPGGYLYVEPPCSHRDASDYLIDDHFWFYNPDSLRYLLGCIGFRDVRCGEGTHDRRLHNVPFVFAAAKRP
jgi:SAM-dependent methyltransferase